MPTYLRFLINFLILTHLTDLTIAKDDVQHAESLEFQAINSYLNSLASQNDAQFTVSAALNEAMDLIKTLGQDTFSSLNEKRDDIETKFWPLLGNNPKTLLAILENLAQASKSCAEESTSFLLLVIKQQTFEGQYLNEYAKKMLNDCYLFSLSQLSTRLQRAVGKLDLSIFDLIEKLAGKVASLQMRAAQQGTLVIKEPTALTSNEKLSQIKDLSFEGVNLKFIDMGMSRLIRDILAGQDEEFRTGNESTQARMRRIYLELIGTPCFTTVSKMAPVLASIQISRDALSQSLSMIGEAIQRQREADWTLDYLLEIYRVCRNLRGNEARFLKLGI